MGVHYRTQELPALLKIAFASATITLRAMYFVHEMRGPPLARAARAPPRRSRRPRLARVCAARAQIIKKGQPLASCGAPCTTNCTASPSASATASTSCASPTRSAGRSRRGASAPTASSSRASRSSTATSASSTCSACSAAQDHARAAPAPRRRRRHPHRALRRHHHPARRQGAHRARHHDAAPVAQRGWPDDGGRQPLGRRRTASTRCSTARR